MKRTWTKTIAAALLTTTVLSGCGSSPTSADKPKEIRLDYAYYSPLSLVIKQKGWAEESFKDDVPVKWVHSAGSNKALEYLAADAVDFGSTAGSAALLSKANGNPIQTVYIYSKPEWTALVVGKDSPIQTTADLKGKKIAATKGTDPFIFLLRILHDAGLSNQDVEIVHLQHADGRAALDQKQVDAWAGLDPHMAFAEVEQGARLIVRNADYNTYGFLNTREAFAKQHPEYVKQVLTLYERARLWALENPGELAQILAAEAQIPLEVAKKQLERNDFSNPVPGQLHVDALIAASKVLVDEALIRKDTDVNAVITGLVNGSFAAEVVKR